MKSAGLSKDEILKIAKEKAPDILIVDIEEKEENFVLVLKWDKEYISPVVKSSHSIRKTVYDGERNTRLETIIAEKTRKEIEDKIFNFQVKLVNSLIQKFGLDDHYRNEYEDHNYIYKIKKDFEDRNGKAVYQRNLGLYYIEKFKKMIPSYEPLWRIIEYNVTQHQSEEAMREYMHAIAERSKQILFAFDTIVDILGTGKTDNDVFFLFTFHLWYFISLIKSLGDNLAWLLHFYLNLGLHHNKISLLDKNFKNKLKTKNPRIASIIYDNPRFPEIESLNKYRDIVQHRHVIHSVRIMHKEFNPKLQKIMIPKNPESLVGYKMPFEQFRLDNKSHEYLGDDEAVVYYGPSVCADYYEPLEFCTKHIDIIREIYTKTLEKIWEELSREAIGKVTNYYSAVKVAEIKLDGELKVDDTIVIESALTHFRQKVESMEINKVNVQQCVNCNVGVKVKDKTRVNDKVYKIVNKVLF